MGGQSKNSISPLNSSDIMTCTYIAFCDRKCIFIQIWLQFVPRDPPDDISAELQEVAWCQTGNKPLPEPIWTQLTEKYMYHQAASLPMEVKLQ